MKKALLVIALVSLMGAGFIYFAYPRDADTPPPFYNLMTAQHFFWLNGPLTCKFYPDGCKRLYLYLGIHAVGSRLLDKNDNLLEENKYVLSFDRRDLPVLRIAETRYFTVLGYLQIFALPALLIIAALSLLILAYLNVSGLRFQKIER